MSRSVTWLGHGSVRLDVGPTALLSDPVLRRRVAHLVRRVPLPGSDALRGLDAVLLTHVHRDHLDLPSLRRLDLPIIAPRGAARLLGGLGPVTELAAGEQTTVGGVSVEATPAAHTAKRGGRTVPCLGYRVDGDLYVAGDTDRFPAMAELGPLELALLPVWGWGPTLGTGHLDPTGAAATLPLLRPRLAVPVHWGTYFPAGLGLRGHRLLHEPGPDFARAAAAGFPTTEVHVLTPGERLVLD